MDSNNLYKTTNLALCPYLVMNGLEYTAYELSSENVNKVIFIFRDPHSKGPDIAMLFTRAPEKVYHNLWGYFRSQLANALKIAKGK